MFDENVVITHTDPKSPVTEAYKVLRTNVMYSGIDKRLKTIVVTSSGPMEGKTTTVVNLAVTFAQAGKNVLLIDSDLRKPKIHRIFMLSNNSGLTNLIANHDEYEKYIRSCDVPNLQILPSGTIPPNPSELLSSNTMKNFVKDISEKYDLVLFDAPPVGSVTDAAIISTLVDGTILVANSGHVEISALKRAKELLSKVDANVIGVVLNKLDKSTVNNYYYHSDYYTNDEKKRKKRGRKHNKENSAAITE
jgi:protein-tyrosine kinase